MRLLRILTLSLLLFPLTVFAQNFEGEVDYQVQFKSKINNVTDTQMTQALGNKSIYYTNAAGNYKSVMNGSVINWQLYIQSENKIYNKFSNGRIQWLNAWSAQDTVYRADIKRDAAVILGYHCDELTLLCKSGIQKYYFSSKLKVDPALFARHRYGNYAAYMAKAGAVPLKYTIQSKEMDVVAVAMSVKPKKLDSDIFTLPAGVEPTPSPENQ